MSTIIGLVGLIGVTMKNISAEFKCLYTRTEENRIRKEMRANNASLLDIRIKLYGEESGRLLHNKINASRSTGLENFINRYGEEEGLIKFNEKNSKAAFTLENQISRYGEEEGTRRFNEKRARDKIKGTLPFYIDKYGEKEGTSRYLEKNSKLSIGAETLKRNGHSDDEIKAIREQHAKKSLITLESLIEKYGEEEGSKRYDIRIEKSKQTSKRRKEYWLNLGMTEEQAELEVKNYQSTSTLEKYIMRYGEEDGYKKYKDVNYRKTRYAVTRDNSVSKLETMFFQELAKITEMNLESGTTCHVLCNDNKYCCDYFHSENKKVIEIFGVFWHMKPSIYKNDDLHPMNNKTAQEIWDKDELKIKNLQESGYEVLVIWEDDIYKDLYNQLDKAKHFLEL